MAEALQIVEILYQNNSYRIEEKKTLFDVITRKLI